MSRRATVASLLRIPLFCAALGLGGCLSTRVANLAPNMVRVDLTGLDVASEGEGLGSALRLAATETLARGYTFFRLVDWSAGPAAIIEPGAPAAANFAVTVVMFHEGEQDANPVFDARRILETPAPSP
jgi:hypothetical protein